MSEKPIATRTLYVVDDKSTQFTIEIFAPKLVSATAGFTIELRVQGAPDGFDYLMVGGHDSYQALVLAISALQSMVEAFNENHMDSKLRFLEDSDPDLHLRVIQD